MRKLKSTLVAVFFFAATAVLPAQEIVDAVKNNNIARVKELVEANPQLINYKDEIGRTPLHWAARGVYFEILRYLVENGANVNAKDNNGTTPLVSVVTRTHLEAAKVLIDSGADINASDNEGSYPIHYAAHMGFKEAIELFLGRGASIEMLDIYGRTPLIIAAREKGDLETIKLLLARGANIDAADRFGDTALSLAAWRGYSDVVDYLIGKEAKISVAGSQGTKLLEYACSKRLVGLYHEIIEEGGDLFALSGKERSALHMGSMGGSREIVDDLIQRNMPINLVDFAGWTPLHYAAYFGREDVVKALLDHGAKIDLKTPLQETPAHLAAQTNKKEVVDLLFSRGADKRSIGRTKIKGKYFGQKKPGNMPELFAPGIVSRLKGGHSNVTFSPDGSVAFWTEWNLTETGYASGSKVLHSKIKNGEWTRPEIILPNGDVPIYSTDGKKIYFRAQLSQKQGEAPITGIWYFEKNGEGFSSPKLLEFDVTATGQYWQFSLDKNETIYFSCPNGLYRSRYKAGKYLEPENLSDLFHPAYKGGPPYISPDVSYIIFSSMDLPSSFGSSDLYIGYKRLDGKWTEPINMGPTINSSDGELLPIVSGDGKYLFFKRASGSLYWISAKIIEELRPKE
ncbi:MAG: ankyrin repeat domain-containing protein [Syntrophaceae bacterium]|nr:ankyrin repeat domain-containing protein [Syntrophaceae bacterium]